MISNLNIPTDTDDEVGLADWLEAIMLVEARSYISRAKIRRYLRSLFAEDQPDVAVDVVLQEISRRRRACRDGYPFDDEQGTGLRFTRTAAGTPYLFMLCISVSKPYRDEQRYKDTDELFDLLIRQALERYLGAGSRGVRFGAPASDARPANFRDAIQWLAQELNLPPGTGKARPTGGDGGLDVVVWRPFRDKRSGYIVLLAQCTVQLDWIGKARDLCEDVWRGWLDLGKDPHLVLAIPHVIPRRFEKWDDLRRLVHSAIDRLRVVELLEGAKLAQDTDVKRWIASEVKRMASS